MIWAWEIVHYYEYEYEYEYEYLTNYLVPCERPWGDRMKDEDRLYVPQMLETKSVMG